MDQHQRQVSKITKSFEFYSARFQSDLEQIKDLDVTKDPKTFSYISDELQRIRHGLGKLGVTLAVAVDSPQEQNWTDQQWEDVGVVLMKFADSVRSYFETLQGKAPGNWEGVDPLGEEIEGVRRELMSLCHDIPWYTIWPDDFVIVEMDPFEADMDTLEKGGEVGEEDEEEVPDEMDMLERGGEAEEEEEEEVSDERQRIRRKKHYKREEWKLMQKQCRDCRDSWRGPWGTYVH